MRHDPGEQFDAQRSGAPGRLFSEDPAGIGAKARISRLSSSIRRASSGRAGQTRANDHDIFMTGPRWSIRSLSFSADGQVLSRELKTGTVVAEVASRRVIWEGPQASLPVFTHRGNRLAYVTKKTGT